MSKRIRFLNAVFVVLVIFQTAMAVIYENRITVALEGIKYATSVYEGGAVNLKAPFMSAIGLISRLTGVHPLIIAGVPMAIIMIPLSYFCYYLLIKTIFNNSDIERIIALYSVWFINMFGYQSDLMQPWTLLEGYFTGYALVLHVILPLCARYIIIHRRKVVSDRLSRREEMGNDETSENGDSYTERESGDYQEEWDMKKHKIVNARNLAIALAVMAILLVAFVYVLNNKINTLYDATVNLQNELNSSCRTYEYAANGDVIAYVVKNTDGSVAVVGGGDGSNADGLCDFILKYSDSVKDWYVYGLDSDNYGALETCMNTKGLLVENIYVIERTDLGR